MMTSAPTPAPACPAAGYPSPSPSPSPADDDNTSLRKRPAGPVTQVDPCKKRRKQATPIRISTTGIGIGIGTATATATATAADVSLDIGLGLCYEGKLPSLHSPDPDPDLDPVPGSHIKVEHSPTNPTNPTSPSLPVNLSGGQNFPPWLSDVQAKTSDWLNTSHTSPAIANHSFYVPVPVSRAVTTSQPPIRIFNPEAYCELCNKEFCNKYFLKTHKANKHRIYTDPATSDAVSLPVNVPSYTASASVSMSASVSAPASISGMKKPSMSDGPTLPSLKNTGTTHSDFMGFSSKMMLKTHRVSVHGAVDHDASAEAEALALGLAVEERDPDLADMGGAPASATSTATVPDKDNILYKTEELSTMDQDENSDNTVVQQRDRDLDFSANRTRRLGIMNPEAFCEICCKEYCNKYFLRTHKMKRHGILIPDENSKDNQKDFKLELSISNNWYQIQTSPLNLIMGEQNTNSSGSCSERKSSPANENECELCGMRFQTLYLAQLHFATAHSQSQNKPSNSNNDEFVATLSANNNDKQAPDSISEDLQKLQTMILQLNDLDVSKVGVGSSGSVLCTCSMCGKEFENRYYLHAHLMTEHGVLLENNKQFEMDNGSEVTPTPTPEVQSIDNQLQSKIPTSSSSMSALTIDKKDDSNGFMSVEKTSRNNTNTNGTGSSVGSERRSSVTMTPANSYCEICNKELCNKYFMKTHMQRMHGIEIENGAQIGGVVCNICNKELCSKYFLRVHKHNTHGIVQDNIGIGVGAAQTRPPNMDMDVGVNVAPQLSSAAATDVSGIPGPDPALKLGDLSDLSNRYFTHFTEVCTICSRRFRSTKWLKAHLLGDHGKAGTEKWNELELQLQQSFGQQQQQQQQQTQQRKSASVGDRSSPTLRIPNGGQDNTKSEGGMQNVLSTIFGTDETNVKQYHCSFCSFSTPVLAFLFVHERSHSHTRGVSSVNMGEVPTPAPAPAPASAVNNTSSSGSSMVNTVNATTPCAISPLYCAVCNQSFRQPEQLHHHIVSQHTFLSLSSFFGNVRQPPNVGTADIRTEPSREESVFDVDQQTQCSKCGSGDVSVTLKDVSKQRQMPATYALPQPQQNKTKYMMQAFLMDEPASVDDAAVQGVDALSGGNTGTVALFNGDEEHHQQTDATTTSTTDRRFAPSIVFLPVLEKLTAPLTVSFTLTPA